MTFNPRIVRIADSAPGTFSLSAAIRIAPGLLLAFPDGRDNGILECAGNESARRPRFNSGVALRFPPHSGAYNRTR